MSNRKKKADLRKLQEAKKKKIIIGIAAAIVLVAVVVGVICIVNCTSDKKKAEPTPPPIAGTIVDNTMAEIDKVQISNGKITYTIRNEIGFPLEGYESDLLSDTTSLATDILNASATISYTKKFEKINSLSEYGLDSSEKSVIITYNDGAALKLIMGDKCSEFEYYVMAEGGDCVYAIRAETYDTLMKHPSDYGNKDVCAMDRETVESFTIYRNGKKDVTVEKDRNFVPTNEYQTTSYVVTYPYNNKNAALGVLWYMFDNIPEKVVADSIVEENPSDLSKYGLSPAVFTLELTDVNGTNTLKFGNDKDGKVYLMCNDSSVVYLVESPLYDIIKDFKASNYVEGYIGLYNIATVSSICITKGEETHTMAIVQDKDFTNYMIDGIVKQEKEFKGIYQSFIAISAKDFIEETPDGEVYAEIIYKFTDSTSISHKYYDYNEDYCIAEAMNGLTGLVLKADIDNLVDSLTKEN